VRASWAVVPGCTETFGLVLYRRQVGTLPRIHEHQYSQWWCPQTTSYTIHPHGTPWAAARIETFTLVNCSPHLCNHHCTLLVSTNHPPPHSYQRKQRPAQKKTKAKLIYNAHQTPIFILALVLGSNHQLRPDELVELGLRKGLELERALLQGDALLVRVLGHLGGHVVADLRIEAGHQHERLVEQLVDLLLVGLDTHYAVFLEGLHAVGEQDHAVQKIADQHRLENVELELALRASDGDGHVVACGWGGWLVLREWPGEESWRPTHDLRADHGQGLALRRVDLSRHDGGARFVLGQAELTKAATRSRSKVADVVGDLHERASECVESTAGLDDSIMGSQSLKLVGRRREIDTGELCDFLGDSHIEAELGVQPGSDSGSTLSEHLQAREASLDPLDAVRKLRRISRELLAQRQRRSILQMGAADLDDVSESLHLCLEGSMQLPQTGQQFLLDLDRSRDVHDGGEGVVRGRAHVDVIVGVHRLLGTHLSTENLDRAVGDDFVRVHVGLGARPGLPNDERKVVKQLAGDDFVGGLLDRLAELRIQSVGHIDGRGRALQDSESLHDGRGHPVEGLVDLEVGERAIAAPSAKTFPAASRPTPPVEWYTPLRLRSPVLVILDFDVAEGVLLDSGSVCLSSPIPSASAPHPNPHPKAYHHERGGGESRRGIAGRARDRRGVDKRIC